VKKRICIINVFYGPYPEWFSFFLKSCETNSFIDWYFFSDQKSIPVTSNNIKHIEFLPGEFSVLAGEKLNIKPEIENSYKICDFKPAFGKIFQEYIKDYDFWGYCDIDLIFGDLSSSINDSLLNTFDVISFYNGFLSGPFCLYRNDTQVNELFKQSYSYPDVYSTGKHFGFDENISKPDNYKITFHKIFTIIQFSFFYVFSDKFQISSWKEFLFQFQWFFKKKTLNPKKLIDMTEVVWFNTRKSEINSYFIGLLVSDRHFNRIKYKSWKLNWKNGRLFEPKNNKSLFAFHFIDLKQDPRWTIAESSHLKDQFTITPKGIYIES
jgi:hypothetical protein